MSEVVPMTCPTCNSDDISYVGSFDEGTMNVECQADGCGSRWYEMWTFTYIEMLEGKNNKAACVICNIPYKELGVYPEPSENWNDGCPFCYEESE